MTERNVLHESGWYNRVKLMEETEAGIQISLVVVDKDIGESVMYFQTDEFHDAIAFADGYAYRKAVENEDLDNESSLWRRVVGRFTRLVG